jgi:hypothetical protein
MAPAQVELTCEGCGARFWRYPNKGRGRFCSKKCKNENHHGKPAAPRTDPQHCKVCGHLKPLAEFPIQHNRRAFRCVECVSKPTLEQRRRAHLWHKFKITLEDWIALYRRQNGRCPICDCELPALDDLLKRMSRHDAWASRNWNTDHCHKTGRVRGITCRTCNVGLGAFHDDPETMRRAASYIERNR